MDIAAISPATLATPQVERVFAPSPSAKQPSDGGLPNARGLAQRLSTEANQGKQAAEQQAPRAAPSESSRSLGPVRFEQEDGTRIAKFFDPKEILIYQVPPEGQLYLVKTGEASSQDQIQTSA